MGSLPESNARLEAGSMILLSYLLEVLCVEDEVLREDSQAVANEEGVLKIGNDPLDLVIVCVALSFQQEVHWRPEE